jgi:hypothetical protein
MNIFPKPPKYKSPIYTKSQQFYSSSSLINCPPFINATMMTLMKLLEFDLSTIHSTKKLKKGFSSRFNHISLNINSWTIINGYNLVTRIGYELGRLNGLWNLNMHEVSKGPTSYIGAMHVQIVWGPYASKETDISTLDNHVT